MSQSIRQAAVTSTPSPSLAQVQSPRLPTAETLLPYLARIDETRWYSNRGELVQRLERRLNALFSGGASEATSLLVTASTGSAAIEAAVLAAAGRATPERPLALMPSYTFVATALSVIRCGYRPYFVDVDPETWTLDPDAIAAHPHLAEAGLVMPVTAYGRVPDMRGWERVHAATGVPVVVDAAPAFEPFVRDPGLVSATVPAALSFHATKSFSTAEGGAVLWRDESRLFQVAQISCFGVTDQRLCLFEGFNGKLSEYHAAMGLACLDEWTRREDAYARIAAAYRGGDTAPDQAGTIVATPEVSAAYVILDSPNAAVSHLAEQRLAARGIGTRRWYGMGLHRQPAFADAPHDPLPVTEELTLRHLGLPAAIDLTDEDIAFVLHTLNGNHAGGGETRIGATAGTTPRQPRYG
ncbi:DegT/DnrJ/EryC1/StrS family aminotransferase [Acuticoccus sp. I52.16.1]|uniref:DegT/DnrJ/EryC1/StrS family aminotransferase n=1 Tax=Acuticoccus sp. I52.16.1 TaxID=2928472 RepID=UPI001FD41694|nr:DegT/DnrJ/EryC1/StrS family aminotransferase [Acuticoccus sp. I52.16.1]UOM37310.1 DegT/DnrJ/EryC1/StrS family aminotransferase [Acuticoccus sp. I52.16.1]